MKDIPQHFKDRIAAWKMAILTIKGYNYLILPERTLLLLEQTARQSSQSLGEFYSIISSFRHYDIEDLIVIRPLWMHTAQTPKIIRDLVKEKFLL